MLRMKSLFAALAESAVRACCTAGLLGLLAACATNGPAPPRETDEQALEQLRTGSAALDCDQSCSAAWRRNRPEMMVHFEANEWRELALLVIQTDYRQDLAYYYLGRAAEAYGESKAAAVYYKTAEALARGTVDSAKCAATPGGCDGLALLTEVLTHLQIVDGHRSRDVRPVRRRQNSPPASVAPSAAPAQAPTGGWVDPPPATP
jgi:hypothetical protein